MSDELRIPDRKGWAIPLAVLMALGYGIRTFGRTEAKVEEAIRGLAEVKIQYASVLEQLAANQESRAGEKGQLDAIQSQVTAAVAKSAESEAAVREARASLDVKLAEIAENDKIMRYIVWGRIQDMPWRPVPGDPLDLMKRGQIPRPPGG